MPFTKLGLNDQLVQGILATGYTVPTAIQARAIPLALEGKDIIGCAQTGTGKTAAFVLPMLHQLTESAAEGARDRRPRALVLTPTRELAQQIEDALKQYGQFLKLRSMSIYGGVDIEKQLKHLRHGVDIIIATPGRLIDHLDRKSLDLSAIRTLVLDEADRMFDMGFINDVKKIMGRVPAERQTLLFSATMSKEIRALASSIQKDPEVIQIGEERRPAESVTQHFYSCPQEMKMDMLLFALEREAMDSVLVFSRTKHGADKITKKLDRAGLKAIAIHSNRTQAQRQRALAGFKQNQFRVLVATDIAARGIDVDGISHVINYDIPRFAEEYVHRIGRTGRASAIGDAITFVSRDEMKYLKGIESFIGRKFELKKYPTFNYTPAAHKQEQAPAKPEQAHGPKHPAEQPTAGESVTRREKQQQRTAAPRPSAAQAEQKQHAHAAERREQPAHQQHQPRKADDAQRKAKPAAAAQQTYRDERPGSQGAGAGRHGKFAQKGGGRGPKVAGSTNPRHDRNQQQAGAKKHSEQRRDQQHKQPFVPRFGQQNVPTGFGKSHAGGQTHRENLPPVKKRVKPAATKTETYSTAIYTDSFGSFRSSAQPQAAQEHDWKKLIESNESTFRKKLRKIFSRGDD